MNFHNKSKFSGYKVRPVYLERVNNYLQGIYTNQVESGVVGVADVVEPEPYANQPQHNSQPMNQPQVVQEERKVTASDLRNKRANLQNHTYNYANKNQFGRSKPSYRVNVSYSNGSFQTDGL